MRQIFTPITGYSSGVGLVVGYIIRQHPQGLDPQVRPKTPRGLELLWPGLRIGVFLHENKSVISVESMNTENNLRSKVYTLRLPNTYHIDQEVLYDLFFPERGQ